MALEADNSDNYGLSIFFFFFFFNKNPSKARGRTDIGWPTVNFLKERTQCLSSSSEMFKG